VQESNKIATNPRIFHIDQELVRPIDERYDGVSFMDGAREMVLYDTNRDGIVRLNENTAPKPLEGLNEPQGLNIRPLSKTELGALRKQRAIVASAPSYIAGRADQIAQRFYGVTSHAADGKALVYAPTADNIAFEELNNLKATELNQLAQVRPQLLRDARGALLGADKGGFSKIWARTKGFFKNLFKGKFENPFGFTFDSERALAARISTALAANPPPAHSKGAELDSYVKAELAHVETRSIFSRLWNKVLSWFGKGSDGTKENTEYMAKALSGAGDRYLEEASKRLRKQGDAQATFSDPAGANKAAAAMVQTYRQNKTQDPERANQALQGLAVQAQRNDYSAPMFLKGLREATHNDPQALASLLSQNDLEARESARQISRDALQNKRQGVVTGIVMSKDGEKALKAFNIDDLKQFHTVSENPQARARVATELESRKVKTER